jgi:peptide deformylase
LQIIHFPHPTLRYKSKPLKRVDAELIKSAQEMFELMYAARGVGLAANQVDLPWQLFVVNLSGEKGVGEELVFINPVVSRPKGTEEAEEGCLSLPGVYANVMRPKQVHVSAFNLRGEEFNASVDGMLARVIQHETDHLQGVMFIDRLPPMARQEIQPSIEEFEIEFRSKQQTGEIADDSTLRKQLLEREQKYC